MRNVQAVIKVEFIAERRAIVMDVIDPILNPRKIRTIDRLVFLQPVNRVTRLVIRIGEMDSITTTCFHLLEDMQLRHAQIAMPMEFTKAHHAIALDVIGRIMIPRKIRITGKLDFPRIVILVINQQIQHGKVRISITTAYFHFLEDIQRRHAHHVIRAVCIKERRANVMDVTGPIMIQREIQTIGNQDFQQIAIAVIDFQIRIGIAQI